MLTLIRTDSNNTAFRELIVLLDRDLNNRYGVKQSEYNNYNVIEFIETVVLAFYENEAVACCCFKKYNDNTIEIKRMFVKPEFRGRGISKMVLRELESWSKELGYAKAILETGKGQPEAIGLYKKSGYNKTPNYDQYVGMNNSICMMKQLV